MAHILVIDDNDTMREGVAAVCERMGHDVVQAASGDEGVSQLKGAPVDLVLTDLKMDGLDGIGVLKAVKAHDPDIAVILITAYASVDTAVDAMKTGAQDYIEKPVSTDKLRVRVDKALEWRTMRTAAERLEATTHVLSGARDHDEEDPGSFEGIIGASAPMQRLFRAIDKIARADTNVHIAGESGTGKELVATALHRRSTRVAGPLIKVNCGAIPETLLESELFGHEKGAFTGADARRVGRFEAAEGGTIFLDEIGDMPLETQAKVLRVLQERTLERVGGNTPIPIDVRVVAATHRDLEKEVEEGTFREDLYYRLAVVPLELPPLRDRVEDIPALSERFSALQAERLNRPKKGFSPEALARLADYGWPGNVRELRNVVEQAQVMASGEVIEASDLFLNRRKATKVRAWDDNLPYNEAKRQATEHFERTYLLDALRKHEGNISRTAETIGLARQSLQQKIKELDLRSEEWT